MKKDAIGHDEDCACSQRIILDDDCESPTASDDGLTCILEFQFGWNVDLATKIRNLLLNPINIYQCNSKICGSHGGDNEDYCLLGCDAV
jgi:hypothetical protein